MNAPRDKSYADSLNKALTDPAEAAAYLDAVMETGDHAATLLALRQVVKAHGMAEVTRRADVGDKSLFKSLNEKGNPTLDTVNKVLHAIGLRLSVEPLASA
jgi:probable addiction module antidote protein